jgi:hypothetical protein
MHMYAWVPPIHISSDLPSSKSVGRNMLEHNNI